MALTFPISPIVGQTYQSGSSNTYEWTGTYWKIKNIVNFNAFSASIVDRINAATNEQDLSYLATTSSLENLSASIETTNAHQQAEINTLIGATGSYATTTALTNLSSSVTTVNNNQQTQINSLIGVTGSYATTTSLTSLSASIATIDTNQQNTINSLSASKGSLSGQLTLTGVLTPTALTTTTHNYNPTGLGAANFLRISATGNISLSGILAPSPAVNQLLFVTNVGTGNILLQNNNAGSSAANRFYMNNDRLLNTDEGVILVYDTITSGWRCLAFQV